MMDGREETFAAAVARVRDRVDTMIDVVERFDWFVEQLDQPPHTHYEVEALANFLRGTLTWPAQKERVLTMLALHPDPRAAQILHDWSPPEEDQQLKLFYKVSCAKRGISPVDPKRRVRKLS